MIYYSKWLKFNLEQSLFIPIGVTKNAFVIENLILAI
jgi:hypothetical protein